MRVAGAYLCALAALGLLLSAGSLWGQMVYAPNRQRVGGNGNVTINETDIAFDQRQSYERNLNVWNENRYETNVLVVPESVSPQYDVVFRQTVTLRGDFTEWRQGFGNHAIVLSRRGAEFSGYVIRNVERLDAAATQFFAFTSMMMMTGQVRCGHRYFYEQAPYQAHVQLGPIEPYGLNLMSMSFHVLVLEDKRRSGAGDQLEMTSLVWEGGVERIDTPVGVFHLYAPPEKTEVRIDRYEHPRSTREPERIESLSCQSLVEAIAEGRQVEYTAQAYTLIIKFTEAAFDPDDGRIKSLHANVYRSAR